MSVQYIFSIAGVFAVAHIMYIHNMYIYIYIYIYTYHIYIYIYIYDIFSQGRKVALSCGLAPIRSEKIHVLNQHSRGLHTCLALSQGALALPFENAWMGPNSGQQDDHVKTVQIRWRVRHRKLADTPSSCSLPMCHPPSNRSRPLSEGLQ